MQSSQRGKVAFSFFDELLGEGKGELAPLPDASTAESFTASARLASLHVDEVAVPLAPSNFPLRADPIRCDEFCPGADLSSFHEQRPLKNGFAAAQKSFSPRIL